MRNIYIVAMMGLIGSTTLDARITQEPRSKDRITVELRKLPGDQAFDAQIASYNRVLASISRRQGAGAMREADRKTRESTIKAIEQSKAHRQKIRAKRDQLFAERNNPTKDSYRKDVAYWQGEVNNLTVDYNRHGRKSRVYFGDALNYAKQKLEEAKRLAQ